MAEHDIPYPPAPTQVPPDLTTPSLSYRLRVLVVLSSLFLFVVLYVGLIVGSAYLCYRSFASLVPPDPRERTHLGLFRDVTQSAERLSSKYNNAIEQAKQGKISEAAFMLIVEQEVLPAWQKERARLGQVKSLTGEEQRLANLLGQSLHFQEESWLLLGRAIRQEDQAAAHQAKELMKRSEELAKQFSDSADRHYRAHETRETGSSFWTFIIGLVAGLLSLFLVKGIFKWRRVEKERRLEITAREQPLLFAFIHRLCRDAGAPRPHRVYLTPEVNASVFYHESLLSLVLPTPKNLVIGLGLVNQLNLSEFKAVLAHEFGHFAQASMKLGSYVYVSNRVISEVVYGRDWLDSLMAALRGTDIRIAVFAWAFAGILWVLRKTLQGLFRLLNFANASLSRQMEFNADLVAVRLTGSDALIHGLARLNLAGEALGQSWSDVSAAADHGLYTSDLFHHQTRAVDWLRRQGKQTGLGEPPVLPEDPHQVVQVFQPEDTSVPKMWATHPTNYDREVNAKRRYLRSPIDERSPWILFQDAPAVREKMTRWLYQSTGRTEELTLSDPEVVQAFIDEEHAETSYHPRYHGLYDHRYLMLGDFDELLKRTPAELTGADGLAEAGARLYGAELKTRMELHRARQEEHRRIFPLVQGVVELTGKDIAFRGARRQAADARELLDQVKKELDEDFDWMAELDCRAVHVHRAMANHVGEETRQELDARYRFHLTVQSYYAFLNAHQEEVRAALGQLTGKAEVTEYEFGQVLDALERAREGLRQVLEAAEQIPLPRLKNVTPGQPLRPLLLARELPLMIFQRGNGLEGKGIDLLLGHLGDVLAKTQRVQFKSLGGLLALQEEVAERWAALQADQAGSPIKMNADQ